VHAHAKPPFVQQNEILRENKFVNWTINKENIVAVTMLTVVVPVFFHSLVKGEMANREEMRGKAVRERW
jgi:hypothetical protein